jgi:nickel-dependent lactate racemase
LVEVWLPYGTSEIPARIPEERLVDILRPLKAKHPIDAVAEAARLVGSNRELLASAKKAKRICIALGPSGNRELLLQLTRRLIQTLLETGIPRDSLAVLLTTDGLEIDPATLPEITTLRHELSSSATIPIPGGKEDFSAEVNSRFMGADLKILLGELRPHHFLGYSGLCDIVFPGLASAVSSQKQLANRKSLQACDIHKERVNIADSVENLFALGFVLDQTLTPAEMSLGSVSGCLKDLGRTLDQLCAIKLEKTSDIVVMSAGGKPMDETLLRAVETFPAGLATSKRDGAIIVAAECASGHGDTEFYEWCAERKEPRHLELRLRHSFNYPGFKATFTLRAAETHRIYLVSTIPDHYVENVFGMRAARTVNSALQTVQRSLGSDSMISVIPDASRVLPQLVRLT